VSTPNVGYPDNQLLSIWRGAALGSGTPVVTSAAPFTAAGYVTNFASLALFVNLQNGVGVTVRVQYYTDATLTLALATYQWVVSSVGTALNVILPNTGDYVVITVQTGQAGNNPVFFNAEPTNVAVSRPSYQGVPNSLDNLSSSIASGASLIIQLPYVVEGNGQLFVQNATAAVSFNIEVDALLESGALASNLARVTAITGSGNLSFLAPGLTTQMLIKNNDAAAHNFSWHCQILGL
jgi:hypothetical protein